MDKTRSKIYISMLIIINQELLALMILKYCSLLIYKEICLILIQIFKIYFNTLTYIGKNSNLTFHQVSTLQEEGYLQNGVLKKILDIMSLILRCSIHGLDSELFALIFKVILILLYTTMDFIIDMQLSILTLISVTQPSTITVRVTKKLRNFYQISISSCGHIMNILISKNIKKDQPQKVFLIKIKYSLLLRITTLLSFR